MTQAAEKARVEQVLLWYDQPEILFIKRNRFEYILAVSSAHADNDENVFIGASMTLGRIEEYQNGKFDLRYAMAHANLRRYWSFLYDGRDPEINLNKISRSSDMLASSLPDSGFFDREHKKIELVEHKTADTEEQFLIDGGWELGEFSNFYGQVEDIYYIYNDIDLFRSPNTPPKTKQTIARAFERSWGGGGSYVAFYDKIANDNSHIAPLRVSGIKYNSPGYVAVKARKKAFDNIIALLQEYADNGRDARKAYNALYRFMSFGGLLKKGSEGSILTSVTEEEVTKLCFRLESYMPGIDFAALLKMAENNVIVAAKVLMSVFRRAMKLYSFFEQGRVTYKGLETDPAADED